MKARRNDRFYNFVASLMFLFDVDWDQDLPNGIGEELTAADRVRGKAEVVLVQGGAAGGGRISAV